MKAWISTARVLPAMLMAAALLAGAAGATGTFTREPGVDRSGNDMAVSELELSATADDCAARCAALKGCVAFTYVKKSTTVPKPVCRLKNAKPFGHESGCCISGALQN